MMSQFRTRIDIPESKFRLSYNTGSVFIGSCFADNVGLRLKEYKLPVEHNPFGVLYNPASIKTCLEILIQRKLLADSDLYFYNDQWLSFDHYSAFSNPDKKECLRHINERIKIASAFLQKSSYLFITFGTAWVYRFAKTGKIVANCHKLPASEFERYLMQQHDIVDEYTGIYKRLKEFNPEIKIIFTVSPIRHWKDGAEMNQVSKSTLLLAIYELRKVIPEIDYFPAYEILMDELRDYRFYASDMLHLSEVAIEYIWNKFVSTYVDEKSRATISEIVKLKKAISHRPFSINSGSYQAFLKTQLQYIQMLQEKHASLNFDEEKNFFMLRLSG
jgi:hypothetical protein